MAGTVADPRLIGARAAPKKRLRFSWSDPRFRSHRLAGRHRRRSWSRSSGIWSATPTATWPRGTSPPASRFLDRVAGIPIGESLIPYNPAVDTYGRALLIGMLNTLKVAVVGIVLATILGTLIGIGRLSNNWLLAKLTAFYVETLRDIPLLLQLLFWYTSCRPAGAAAGAAHRRRRVPVQPRHEAAAAGLGRRRIPGRCSPSSSASSAPWLWNRRARRAPGGDRACGPRSGRSRSALLIGLPVVVWAALGAPFTVDMPALRGFNFQGGAHHQPGILRAAARPGDLHRRLHRRDRPLRHPGRAARPMGGRAARSACAAAPCCARSCCRRRCG